MIKADLAGTYQRLHQNTLEEAFQAERSAADLCGEEPSRSVLYRSAATLALQKGDRSETVRLARCGLDGAPPPEIEEELWQLVRKAWED